MASYIKTALAKRLALYFKDMTPDRFSLSFFKGEAELSGLELRDNFLQVVIRLLTPDEVQAKEQLAASKTQDGKGNQAGQGATSATPASTKRERYGTGDIIGDGIVLHIGTLAIRLVAPEFDTTLDVSHLWLQNTNHQWEVVDDLKSAIQIHQRHGFASLFKMLSMSYNSRSRLSTYRLSKLFNLPWQISSEPIVVLKGALYPLSIPDDGLRERSDSDLSQFSFASSLNTSLGTDSEDEGGEQGPVLHNGPAPATKATPQKGPAAKVEAMANRPPESPKAPLTPDRNANRRLIPMIYVRCDHLFLSLLEDGHIGTRRPQLATWSFRRLVFKQETQKPWVPNPDRSAMRNQFYQQFEQDKESWLLQVASALSLEDCLPGRVMHDVMTFSVASMTLMANAAPVSADAGPNAARQMAVILQIDREQYDADDNMRMLMFEHTQLYLSPRARYELHRATTRIESDIELPTVPGFSQLTRQQAHRLAAELHDIQLALPPPTLFGRVHPFKVSLHVAAVLQVSRFLEHSRLAQPGRLRSAQAKRFADRIFQSTSSAELTNIGKAMQEQVDVLQVAERTTLLNLYRERLDSLEDEEEGSALLWIAGFEEMFEESEEDAPPPPKGGPTLPTLKPFYDSPLFQSKCRAPPFEAEDPDVQLVPPVNEISVRDPSNKHPDVEGLISISVDQVWVDSTTPLGRAPLLEPAPLCVLIYTPPPADETGDTASTESSGTGAPHDQRSAPSKKESNIILPNSYTMVMATEPWHFQLRDMDILLLTRFSESLQRTLLLLDTGAPAVGTDVLLVHVPKLQVRMLNEEQQGTEPDATEDTEHERACTLIGDVDIDRVELAMVSWDRTSITVAAADSISTHFARLPEMPKDLDMSDARTFLESARHEAVAGRPVIMYHCRDERPSPHQSRAFFEAIDQRRQRRKEVQQWRIDMDHQHFHTLTARSFQRLGEAALLGEPGPPEPSDGRNAFAADSAPPNANGEGADEDAFMTPLTTPRLAPAAGAKSMPGAEPDADTIDAPSPSESASSSGAASPNTRRRGLFRRSKDHSKNSSSPNSKAKSMSPVKGSPLLRRRSKFGFGSRRSAEASPELSRKGANDSRVHNSRSQPNLTALRIAPPRPPPPGSQEPTHEQVVQMLSEAEVKATVHDWHAREADTRGQTGNPPSASVFQLPAADHPASATRHGDAAPKALVGANVPTSSISSDGHEVQVQLEAQAEQARPLSTPTTPTNPEPLAPADKAGIRFNGPTATTLSDATSSGAQEEGSVDLDQAVVNTSLNASIGTSTSASMSVSTGLPDTEEEGDSVSDLSASTHRGTQVDLTRRLAPATQEHLRSEFARQQFPGGAFPPLPPIELPKSVLVVQGLDAWISTYHLSRLGRFGDDYIEPMPMAPLRIEVRRSTMAYFDHNALQDVSFFDTDMWAAAIAAGTTLARVEALAMDLVTRPDSSLDVIMVPVSAEPPAYEARLHRLEAAADQEQSRHKAEQQHVADENEQLKEVCLQDACMVTAILVYA
ncbi:uncharacterized protein MONBRDRAFT_30050 [Monosiga brevicollis MX1]|uniref:Uncharacterized protein n=1 Tax=Monosiga brevicollis TaxID=81824 RepID=A9VCV8_MONBE|nr:uncharacterized protein MONBRDRAFT_30050 [Monosiga brevicollis MX1]EDQ84660.1 predicted protein [Monosiga brevicollis MX1]|eukprot:XP_001750564.1 hypothetical protein [Monosiga brevicollis MX1]